MARILLVDDEAEIVLIVKKFLSKFNYDVLTATSGSAALELIAREPKFDLVVLDVKMPGMNGIEVLATLRASGNTVPVLVLSGSIGTQKDLEALRQLGQKEEEIIFKPVDLYELAKRVQDVVSPGGDGVTESR